MGTRGVPGDVEAVGIAPKARGIAIDPCHSAAYLRGYRHQTAADILHPGEVWHDAMRAGMHEQLGREGVILGEACAPRTPMEEDVDRRIGALGRVDVEPLNGGRPIGIALWRTQARAHVLAVGGVAPGELR
jgi:hypothetical protein